MKQLILGGARSGKSAMAERYARESGLEVACIVTAEARDGEMAERIRRHRAHRPHGWLVSEEPVSVAKSLEALASPRRCVVIDCLTLWLSNVLEHDRAAPGLFERERSALISAVERASGDVVLVGNEVGQGIVPLGELTRRFCDEAGRLHQHLAAVCDRVVLMVAGLPLHVKG